MKCFNEARRLIVVKITIIIKPIFTLTFANYYRSANYVHSHRKFHLLTFFFNKKKIQRIHTFSVSYVKDNTQTNNQTLTLDLFD